MQPDLDAAALRAAARELFQDAPPVRRLIQTYRIDICPFGRLISLIPPGSSVLDVGCGSGLLLGLLARSGRLARGVGFDASRDAIETAQAMARRVDPSGQQLVFHRLDASADWPGGTFDVVALIDVLHHVDPAAQQAVIARAASRVKPGGLLLYKDMASKPWWRAGWNRLHDLVLARQWIRYVPIGSVETWAGSQGLARQTREDHICCGVYGHELLLLRKPA